MRHIIQELMQPRIFKDGHIRTPTPIMLKAGKALMNLLTITQQDRTGRLKAEYKINELTKEICELRKPTDKDISLEDAITIYRETMNKEYVSNFT